MTDSSVAMVVVTGVDVTSEPPAGSHTVVITSTVLITCCVTVYQTRSRFASGTAATKPMRGKRAMVVDAFMFAAEIEIRSNMVICLSDGQRLTMRIDLRHRLAFHRC